MCARERGTGENKQEEKGIVRHLLFYGVNTLSFSEFDHFFVPTKCTRCDVITYHEPYRYIAVVLLFSAKVQFVVYFQN